VDTIACVHIASMTPHYTRVQTVTGGLVCKLGHGAIKVYYRGRRMAFTELQEEIPKASRPVPPAARVIVVTRVDTKRSQSVRNLIAWNGQFPISGLPTNQE